MAQKYVREDILKLMKMTVKSVNSQQLILLLTPYSLLLTPYSLLLTPYSLLLTPYSLLLTPYSLLPTSYLRAIE